MKDKNTKKLEETYKQILKKVPLNEAENELIQPNLDVIYDILDNYKIYFKEDVSTIDDVYQILENLKTDILIGGFDLDI